MGIFQSFFSGEDTIHEHWSELTQVEQLDILVEESSTNPVVIYKHSVACNLSDMKKVGLMSDWDFDVSEISFYYLNLLKYRGISNAIEQRFNVRHESPQLIVLQEGNVIYHTSHHEVRVENIRLALMAE